MFGLQRAIVAIGVAALMAVYTVALPTKSHAATITFYDDPAGPADKRGTLTCSVACSALFSTPGTYNTTVGGVFTVHPPNETTQTNFVNANLKAGDSSFLVADADKTEPAPSSFSTDALYILLKIGGGHTLNSLLVRNDSGAGGLELSWDGESASGLSHYTEFGELPITTIPLPAGGLLLLTALGGLGIAARRRRKAA
ncbi:VPLPA-CTERM sorting domain-containing protein [Roseovarius spongiae]|uniref:VPLPA-CTERM sorting domain-containing protein n=1 Tax=Roseovarius spongiae TaxID=2320272 RepID=A0A3A8ARD9_9RHOB|nr:VPLPA-CTERM sorting domain-containing protein [Roseovarius spongiae]RKF12435.1 VPLPA-CTERM sorting domain-containing protein [Roseovarius spongiae]